MKFKLKKLHVYFIAFIAMVLPNIVLLKEVPQPLDSIYYIAFPKGEVNLDFFSYYKMVFLLISTALLLIIFALNRMKTLKWHRSYTFLLIYAFFIVLSTFTSPFLPLAIRGLGDRYEGFGTLIAYLLLFYVTHASIEDKEDINIILAGIIGGSLIVGTIGIFQYFGLDFFRSNLGRSLILTRDTMHMKDTLNFTFGKYTIYSTLYNTNFVGSYMIMMLYLGIGLVLKNKGNKKIIYRILPYIYTVFIFANLIGCRSRAGFMAAQATSIFAVIFFFKYIKIYYRELLILLASFALVFIGMDRFSRGAADLSDKLFSIDGRRNTLRAVYSRDGYLIFESVYGDMKLIEEEGNITFYDMDKVAITPQINTEHISRDGSMVEANIIYFEEDRYKAFNFIIEKDHVIFVYDKSINLPIYFRNNKYKSPGIDGKLFELVEIERFKPFDGREGIGSHRVYIWSRTIPLLRYTILSGFGPDTYSIVFPQNDSVGKAMSFRNTNIIVDKPHNLYLQIGVNTGVLSLVNFIVACAIFLIVGVYIYRRDKVEARVLDFNIYLGSIAYLVTGLFNDSLVSVAPIFWIYWAVGVYLLLGIEKE